MQTKQYNPQQQSRSIPRYVLQLGYLPRQLFRTVGATGCDGARESRIHMGGRVLPEQKPNVDSQFRTAPGIPSSIFEFCQAVEGRFLIPNDFAPNSV